MKKRTMRIMAVLCVATLAMGMLVGCGSKKDKADDKAKTEAKTEAAANTEENTDSTEQVDASEAVVSDSADGLLSEVADEDSFAVLSGVGDGWAPTVMVLLNDKSFYCLVDYAGQATVNFVQGTWAENADGSITATGALYTDGSEVVIEVAKGDDGKYTTEVGIPDTEMNVSLEGSAK
ncbi:MAG: hypothetical protein K6B67_07855 [Lachnospiraceae bacterium]|nr:hypothetical protein [Lachnospiraceae bacterium]